MFELGRLIRSRMHAYPTPSMPQLEALHFVHGRGPATMRELAAHLKIKAPSATALVGELCRAGMLSRSTGTADRRSVMLRLTARGARQLRLSIARRQKVIAELLSPLPPGERARFNRILETVVSANR